MIGYFSISEQPIASQQVEAIIIPPGIPLPDDLKQVIAKWLLERFPEVYKPRLGFP